jgi:integrase
MARIPEQSFAAVINAFLASPKLKSLAPATQQVIRRYLLQAQHPDTLGAYPAAVMRPALVQAFLDGYADKPGAQQMARSGLKMVEKWALVRDLIAQPITTGTEVVGSDGDGHEPWTDAQVAIAEAHARPDIARIVTLAANTGQRRSDLYKMRWTDIEVIDGRPGIHVKQKKTKVQIWIPMTQPLMAAIETWEKRPSPLLMKDSGGPWRNEIEISEAWTRERDRNPQLGPCAGLVLHGLRATACIRLRRAGATESQISAMVGLSIGMVGRYCRRADQKKNAMAAVVYLDRARTGSEHEQRKNANRSGTSD